MLDFQVPRQLDKPYPSPPLAGVPVYRWDGVVWTTQDAPTSQPDGVVRYDAAQTLTSYPENAGPHQHLRRAARCAGL